MNSDSVFLHGIKADLVVGLDAWHRNGKPQPVILNIDLIPVDGLEAAALEDNVALTLDYGKLYKSLLRSLIGQAFESIQHLFHAIQDCLPPVKSSLIEILLPKAILLSEGGLGITRRMVVAEDTGPVVHQRLELRKIPCKCIIGVNSHERLEKQRLIITISTEGVQTPLATAVVAGVSLDDSAAPVWLNAVRDVVERVDNSSYLTIEALASAIAQTVTMNHGFENATVRIDKPGAIATIDAAGVQVSRTRAFFENKDFWKVKRP